MSELRGKLPRTDIPKELIMGFVEGWCYVIGVTVVALFAAVGAHHLYQRSSTATKWPWLPPAIAAAAVIIAAHTLIRPLPLPAVFEDNPPAPTQSNYR